MRGNATQLLVFGLFGFGLLFGMEGAVIAQSDSTKVPQAPRLDQARADPGEATDKELANVRVGHWC